jgi:hypothetical protein
VVDLAQHVHLVAYASVLSFDRLYAVMLSVEEGVPEHQVAIPPPVDTCSVEQLVALGRLVVLEPGEQHVADIA